MTNEDAIKWLDNLKNDIGNPHYERLWPYAQAIDEICSMLKEQEAVKPEVYYVSEDKYKFYRCPVCKIAWYYKGNYCLGCGRAVKWE